MKPLIENTMFGKIDKVTQAIKRIRSFEPLENGFFDTRYQVAYSGGKDSDVIRILCELSGVPFDLVHNLTTVDAPETVYYVKSIPRIQIFQPDLSMWELIVKKGMPPTRIVRYCCESLKEYSGRNRFVMTGVRWAESIRRKHTRGSVEILGNTKKNKLILNAENAESRRILESCAMKGKRLLNPIVDWSNEDVWEFLSYYNCESNPLYKEGYTRIGCVGCPMAGKKRVQEFERWPKYKDNYIRAFQRMLEKHNYRETGRSWVDGESVFRWWMQEKYMDTVEGQLSFLHDL